MTQSNALTLAAPQPEGFPVSTGPKLDFVLKKHKWLIVLGTVLGLVLGTGLYLAFRVFDPRYRATAVFKVEPALPNPLERSKYNLVAPGSSTVTRLLNDQIVIVRSPTILGSALETPAFQRNYRYPNDPHRQSTWLQAHPVDPLDKLKRDLTVSPLLHTNDFQITMYWHDPRETADLVNAVAGVYTQYVSNEEQRRLSREAKSVSAAEHKVRDRVTAMQAELETYRVSHDVPGLIERRGVMANMLTQLNGLLIKAQLRVQEAQASYQEIQRQVKNNTLTLTPAMQELVERDPSLRELHLTLLSLKQNIAVSKATLGAEHRSTIALEIRAASVRRQIDRLRQKLEARARLQMEQTAATDVSATQAMAVDARHRRDQQQRLVRDMDAALAGYENRARALKTQQTILKDLTNRAVLLNLRRSQNASRVILKLSATPARRMSYPILSHFLGLGTALGLLLAVALAYLIELTNTRVRTPRDITAIMRLPLLGFIPEQADDPLLTSNPMTCIRTSPGSMTAESFRQIRGRLAAAGGEKPLQTILVAGFSPGGGASTVASNLANGAALSELRVLLVDANFYRPVLQSVYTNIPSVGLADVLAGRATLDQAIVQNPELPTLYLLGSGARTRAANEITEHRAFPDIMAQLRGRFDMIIFDGAPLTFVSDSINLAAKVDGVIAVLRAGLTTRGTVARIRDQLGLIRANLLGIVLNAAQSWSAGYFRQNYRAFFEYAGQGSPPRQEEKKSLPHA